MCKHTHTEPKVRIGWTVEQLLADMRTEVDANCLIYSLTRSEAQLLLDRLSPPRLDPDWLRELKARVDERIAANKDRVNRGAVAMNLHMRPEDVQRLLALAEASPIDATAVSRLVQLVRTVIRDLPRRRDWLNPDTEAEIRHLVGMVGVLSRGPLEPERTT